jgi:tetratricopeptide (TPR) repeat protein
MGLVMTARDADAQTKTPCVCGSGLAASRCCALDWTAVWPAPDARAEVKRADAAYTAGDAAKAEQILAEALNASPLNPLPLKAFHELLRVQNRIVAADAVLSRIVRQEPNNLAAVQALALSLFQRSALAEAEVHARNAVRLAPTDPQSHNLMGMILTDAQRPQIGEFHYRRAVDLLGAPNAILMANLAWNLRNQGKMAEARALYEKSVALDPQVFQTVFGWAQMEESDRNFDRAGELLDAAEALAPAAPSVTLARAVLHGRMGQPDQAVALLDGMQARRTDGGLGPIEWSEKGRLLDRLGRHADAFAAFDESKRTLRAMTGQAYLAAEAQGLVRSLTGFFTAGRMQILPRAGVRTDTAQPVFIVGFPRSGTTMIEQTLTAHPKISAGDELPTINELTMLMPRMLNSPLAYPEALSELWMGDQAEGLDNLRDYYLQRARQLGAISPKAAWFTDKMPLNETHLGLISLIFPKSPIIHLIRHPLDVVLSVFSNHLTHGFFCAYELQTIARHYVLVMELVEHYRRELALNYLAVRYEDVVDDQEAKVREMLAFVGAPFDRRCLNFQENKRYARTASYAQVTEKLYDRSRYRYRPYRKQLEPVIPILEPLIRRLGYEVEG